MQQVEQMLRARARTFLKKFFCRPYLLAKTKGFEAVGYLAQHSNRATTENYEGVAEGDEDAILYFPITPASLFTSNVI